jgi:hypothetical protein
MMFISERLQNSGTNITTLLNTYISVINLLAPVTMLQVGRSRVLLLMRSLDF